MNKVITPSHLANLKREANSVKRTAPGMTHAQALDAIASRQGYANWSLLAKSVTATVKTLVAPQHVLYIIAGEEASRAFQNGTVNAEVASDFRQYVFATAEEKVAFHSGFDEMVGWASYRNLDGEPDSFLKRLRSKHASAMEKLGRSPVEAGQHGIEMVYGSEACSDVEERRVTQEVVARYVVLPFATQAEARAFLYGTDEADGWMEYCIVDDKNPRLPELKKLSR